MPMRLSEWVTVNVISVPVGYLGHAVEGSGMTCALDRDDVHDEGRQHGERPSQAKAGIIRRPSHGRLSKGADELRRIRDG
jgi:hypothetical protein